MTLTWSANVDGAFEVRAAAAANTPDCTSGATLASGQYVAANGNWSQALDIAMFADGTLGFCVGFTDPQGMTATASTSVVKDTRPQILTVPGSLSVATEDPVLVWSSDESGTHSLVSSMVDCAHPSPLVSGSHTSGVPVTTVVPTADLSEGQNDLTLCTRDAAGNLSTSLVSILKDSRPPIITLVSPNPTIVTRSLVNVWWLANEAGTFSASTLSNNCDPSPLIPIQPYSPANSTYTSTFNPNGLAEGYTVVRICVRDNFQNLSEKTVTLLKDWVRPFVRLNLPIPNTTRSSATISWTSSENGPFQVRVHPSTTGWSSTPCTGGTVVESGTYSGAPTLRTTLIPSAALLEGANPISVCVFDSVGFGWQAGSITKDSIPPTISIQSVSPNPTNAGITLTLTRSEYGTFRVRRGSTNCSDGTEIASLTGSYSPVSLVIPPQNLPEGVTSLRVCFTDPGLHEASLTTSVTKDSIAPTLSLACIPPTSGTATLAFSANENGPFSVRLGSTGCSDGVVAASGSYLAPGERRLLISSTGLQDGNNTLRVCLSDALNNVGTGTANLRFGAPRAIDLQDPSGGRTFLGSRSNGELGSLTAGDLDGDGVDDLVVAERPGRPEGTAMRMGAGSLYGYRGGAGFFSGGVTRVPSGAWFQVIGGDREDDLGVRNLGRLISGMDVDGDGFGDLVVSAPGADGIANARPNAGEVYVLSGAMLGGTLDLAGDILPSAVFSRIIGPVAGGAAQILDADDVDGDGVGDLLVGVPMASPSGRQGAGELYLLRGAASLAGTVDLASATPLAHIQGAAAGDQLGTSGALGDLGGSSDADILLGAPRAAGSNGAAYVFFGPFVGAPIFDAASPHVLWTGAAGSRLGHDVDIAQVRGDDAADAVITARRWASDAGAVGGVAVHAGPLAPGVLPNTEPHALGAMDGDSFGASVQLGDLDGDGYADTLLGAYRSDGPTQDRVDAGSVTLLLGGACMAPLRDLRFDVPALHMHGARAGAHLGRFRESTGLGDLDGDGKLDVCAGAPFDEDGSVSCVRTP